ncbi:MAG: Ig-like domain-containing protein, partial [Bacteroidota bacterium]
VRLDAQNYNNIKHVELYINGKLIRKETQYPYEWAKGQNSSDGYLRNLKAGTYKLKARVQDKCGKYKDYYCTFYVKGNGNDGDNTGGQCAYRAWFKTPENGKKYKAGSTVYVKVDAQNYNKINYVELYVNGKLVRKESQYPYEWAKGSGSSDGYLRNLKAGTYKLKARVYDKCGKYKDLFATFYVIGRENNPGGGNTACKYKSWFKYPKNNGTYRYGDDVYVRVDTEKYQDIAEMQLYVNGKFVRKETTYPYEWCKGSGNSDSYLRNLKRGTYNLKVRVKTKCGQWYEYFCKFYVR